MKGNGRMICRMDMGLKHGRMGRSLKGIILLGRNREGAFINGRMGQSMKASGRGIGLKVKALILGQIKGNIQVHGLIIICMGRVFIFGLMGGNMKVLMKMIKNKDLEFILGRMEENMKVIGLRENNMAVGSLFRAMKGGKVFGRKAKGLSGLKIALMKVIRILKNDCKLKINKFSFFF